MRFDDAVALLISAHNAERIALNTLKRARKDIASAVEVLLQSKELATGEVLKVDGYSLVRGRKRGRRQIDQHALLDAWEELPGKIRQRFDTSYQGTVAELVEVMGEAADPYLRLVGTDETVLVKELSGEEEDGPERIEFGG